jgi:hypothetical protein
VEGWLYVKATRFGLIVLLQDVGNSTSYIIKPADDVPLDMCDHWQYFGEWLKPWSLSSAAVCRGTDTPRVEVTDSCWQHNQGRSYS